MVGNVSFPVGSGAGDAREPVPVGKMGREVSLPVGNGASGESVEIGVEMGSPVGASMGVPVGVSIGVSEGTREEIGRSVLDGIGALDSDGGVAFPLSV